MGEPFEMDNSLQLLMMQVSRTYGWKIMEKIQEFGIHPRQLPMFMTIVHEEGISQRALAEQLHNTPPTVNVSVQRLEKAGLVVRERDKQDQRKIHILLTDQGRQVVQELREAMKEMEQLMLQDFSEEESSQLQNYFERILKNIGGIPGDLCPEGPVGGEEAPFD